jgi:putative membrane protein
MMWHNGWTGTNWVLMAVLMLLFWGAVAALVLWLLANRRVPQPPTPAARPDGPQARAILDERLARGELSAEEYQERRDLLTPR